MKIAYTSVMNSGIKLRQVLCVCVKEPKQAVEQLCDLSVFVGCLMDWLLFMSEILSCLYDFFLAFSFHQLLVTEREKKF